ncbi:MAG: HAD hydrolase-like protein [bacterium]|nr:HAD hydrolase-like protein [bacterium]
MSEINKSKVRAILWDVDGTLFSSEEIIHRIYQSTFEKYRAIHGVPAKVPTLEEIVAQIGKPVKTIFENLAPDVPEARRYDLSLGILHGLVSSISAGEGEHYPQVLEVLSQLHAERGYQFYGVSNGRYPYIEAILRQNGTFAMFADIPTIDNRTLHDKNQLVAHILERYGLAPAECVLIGDRTSDRDAAVSNGVPFIAATYGHGESAEWDGAAARIDSLPELLDLL